MLLLLLLLHTVSARQAAAPRGQPVVLLSDADRDKLEDMLRGLTAERAAIAEARRCYHDCADRATFAALAARDDDSSTLASPCLA